MMQKTWKMAENLANGYSYEGAKWEPSNEYKHDRVYFHPCALDESSLSIGRVKISLIHDAHMNPINGAIFDV